MQQIQNHDFPPSVEEQDVGTVPVSCAWESGMKWHPAACASACINVLDVEMRKTSGHCNRQVSMACAVVSQKPRCQLNLVTFFEQRKEQGCEEKEITVIPCVIHNNYFKAHYDAIQQFLEQSYYECTFTGLLKFICKPVKHITRIGIADIGFTSGSCNQSSLVLLSFHYTPHSLYKNHIVNPPQRPMLIQASKRKSVLEMDCPISSLIGNDDLKSTWPSGRPIKRFGPGLHKQHPGTRQEICSDLHPGLSEPTKETQTESHPISQEEHPETRSGGFPESAASTQYHQTWANRGTPSDQEDTRPGAKH
eukprot:bmy_21921T0